MNIMNVRRTTLLASAVVLAAVFAPGTAAAAATCPLADDPRPELRTAQPGLWRTHDGIVNANFAARVNQSLYDRVVERDYLSKPDGTGTELKPGIATSWKRLSDTEWELKIRKGVKFHDGTPLTAADIAYSISKDRNEIAPRAKRYNTTIASTEAVDDHTLRVKTTEPDAVFLWRMASPLGAVVPKKRYLAEGKEFGNHPITTGPYKWHEKRDGEYILLVANDDYWGGKPPLKCITFFDVPENSTRVAGLLSGQFDMITSVPLEQKKLIDREKGFKTQVAILENRHGLLLTNNPNSTVHDKRVRQAMEYAIDRQAMVDGLWGGLNWVKQKSWREYGDFHIDASVRTYDPEKAKALLAEAGYKGAPINISMVMGYYVNLDRAIQIMEQQWKAVGLNIVITRLENWSQMGKQEDRMKLDGFFNSLSLDFVSPVYEYSSNWGNKTSERGKRWEGPAEYYEYSNTLATSFDQKARLAAWRKMHDIIADENPSILLYRPVDVWGVREGVNWKNYGSFWQDFRAHSINMK